ncbi:YdbH family protein [Rosenbergiella sp. S61]|uniref:YdbH family protein n=1 Tax=Rosenbergiella gaditana TaxID=2726987 RepID=A0ABS5SSM4_9GAMM|nr:YdbH family protein [Rosenbergiella gaditana]MBT0723065.1 YdbH family protein [Rosenbergiella gaditana]
MSLALRYILFAAAIVGISLLGLGLSINQWSIPLVQHFLPKGVSVERQSGFSLSHAHFTLPSFSLSAQGCQLAQISPTRIALSRYPLKIAVDKLTINSNCFTQWPSASTSDQKPLSLRHLQQIIPSVSLDIASLSISPWQTYQGALHFSSSGAEQHLTYHGQAATLDAELSGQMLNLKALSISHPLLKHPLNLSGKIRLADGVTVLPDEANLVGKVELASYPNPLTVTLSREHQHGALVVKDTTAQQPLLNAPFNVSQDEFRIEKGTWAWPMPVQHLSGFFSLSAENWQQGFEQTLLSGRVNALTQGRGGKGNVVLTLGPGKLSFYNNQFPLRLTGTAKLKDLQFYAGLPAALTGALIDPAIHFQPKALLLMRGEILPGWEVDEARWPIAGARLTQQGLSGLLQANFMVRNERSSFYLLHLAGMADSFLPDKGRWDWRYWGKGMILPLTANWDVQGRGFWHNEEITLTSLSTGFDQIRYGSMLMQKPRMTLTEPVHWVTQQDKPQFTGQFKITADHTFFGETSQLPAAQLDLDVNGTTPDQFGFKGQLVANRIGPVSVIGRRDNSRWLGRAWWPEQPLSVFQPLAGPSKSVALRSGSLRAQAAFSLTEDKGFQAGGHWVVKQGDIWLPNYQFKGLNFSLPFRFNDHRWHFGLREPVSLTIENIENKFPMSHLTLKLKGSWPWDEQNPLEINDASLDIFGGTLALAHLRLPQRQSALLAIKHLGMSQLITAIHPKQIAMSGKISGQLPFWLENSPWLIENGWIRDDKGLTLRVDKDLLDQILKNNLAAGAAIDWLRYMEISKSYATVQVSAKGELLMKSQIHGTSRFDDKRQRVNLNYQHTENIFMLWRSLSYGDNLQSWLEEQTRLPANKENAK